MERRGEELHKLNIKTGQLDPKRELYEFNIDN
jgi:hypothetical protein